MKILDGILEAVRRSGGKVIPGGEIFRLYDTYGFPLDLVRDVARDGGLEMDEAGFQAAMDAQRERARASWVGQEEAVAPIYRELESEIGGTEFVGYETLESDAVVKAVVRGGRVVEEVAEGGEAEVFLDRTPFYGEAGGQVGDTGHIHGEGLRLLVMDTKKPLDGMHSHHVRVEKGRLRVWARVKCRVDADRRRAIMRNHTATHLLQAALRGALGEHVKQAGSLVEPERLRFDFTHFSGLEEGELRAVEETVNEKIMENLRVEARESDIKEAVASGAIALFGEKYGEKVRTISVEGFSRELCGGTHVGATGEIGLFVIASEGSVASGIRRIEAVTGRAALERVRREREELEAVERMLRTSEPVPRLRELLDEVKELERERERLKGSQARDVAREIAGEAREVDGLKVVARKLQGLDQKELRTLADNVRDRLGSGVVVLASEKDGQAALLAMVTKDLTGSLKAGDILKAVAAAAGGRGGGKADMAQGGTRELDKLDSALQTVYDMVKGARDPGSR